MGRLDKINKRIVSGIYASVGKVTSVMLEKVTERVQEKS
jgi:hypothetical protein